MLKKIAAVLVIVAMGSFATNCMGKIALTQKVYSFNKGLGNKWVNNGVFILFLVVPVYPVSLFLDVIIFNPIKFWTGTAIVAMEEGETETQYAEYKGRTIKMVASRNQMEISLVDNPEEKTIMRVDPQTGSWYVDSEAHGLKDFKFADSDPKTGEFTKAYHPSGKVIPVQR